MLDLTRARFEGPMNARDCERAESQLGVIHELMKDGEWRTLAEIEKTTGYPQASISAQLRHLKKHRFGAHIVEKQRREFPSRSAADSGTWEYRMEERRMPFITT